MLVEDFVDYKILIQVSEDTPRCYFHVWYANFNSNGKILEFGIPSHDYLITWYMRLKELSKDYNKYLIKALIRLIRDRMSVEEIVEKYFASLDENIKLEISKFLSTLKWISLQEDTNYPPPRRMGSKYTLAVYALLEAGFNMSEIRRVIKF